MLSNFELVIRIIVLLVFIVVTGIALQHRKNDQIRSKYLTFLFICIVIPGGILGGTVLPFASWGLYPNPTPTEVSSYELRVVDDANNELQYDTDALPLTSATPVSRFAENMVTEYNQTESEELACFFLERAQRHKASVGDSSLGEYAKFPPHEYSYSWDGQIVDQYGEFTSIRVYYVEETYSGDGTEIVNRTESMEGEHTCS